MKRSSYQNGSVVRKPRKKGPDVWVYRYTDSEGIKKSEHIGTVKKYPTKAAATKQAAKLREEINERVNCIRVSGLCDRYQLDGLPARESTAGPYRSYLKRFKEEWGDWRVDELAKNIIGIENWIDELHTFATEDRIGSEGKFVKGRPARPMAKKSKKLMKGFVHRLFELAIKWGHITMQRNPIDLVEVKGRSGRTRTLLIVTLKVYHKLLVDEELPAHVRMMIVLAMCLGLRASEFLGIRPEEDFDYKARTLKVQRSVVGQHEDDTKTPESTQTIPLHRELAEAIREYVTENPPIEGWMFGNPATKRPYWRGTLQQDYLEPAGRRAGILGLGWHSFRHTYRTLLADLKQSMEVQQRMMRHTDIKTTMSYGDQTIDRHRRVASNKVFEMIKKKSA